jgi:hypothetical protein
MNTLMGNAYSSLVGKHKGKRPCGRLRCKWEDTIRINLKEIGWEGVDWMHLAQDSPVADLCEHSNELLHSIKGGEFLD